MNHRNRYNYTRHLPVIFMEISEFKQESTRLDRLQQKQIREEAPSLMERIREINEQFRRLHDELYKKHHPINSQ